MKGIVFDLKEFALNDGHGIRTTVFLKGCPLRCLWCHNPEGLSAKPELYLKQNGCLSCGLCKKTCSHPDCQPFGRCLHICPNNLVTVKGTEWEAADLAKKLLRNTDVFRETDGGITLSGGEPLMQSAFCEELLGKLHGKIHCAIETSGYADSETYRRVCSLCDFVYQDLKVMNEKRHRELTGVSNERILANAQWLKGSSIPHVFRTPLIPSLTDTEENLNAVRAFVGDDDWERLPYNTLAPAKYKNVGRKFSLDGSE